MKSKLKKVITIAFFVLGVVGASETKEVKAQIPGPTPEPGIITELPGHYWACICPIYVGACRCIRY